MSGVLSFISWYTVITFIGILSFPIAFSFFPRLNSRGYALIRPLSLLIWGFLFWLFCSLGVLQNDLGGVLVSLGILPLFSILLLRNGKWVQLKTWIKNNWHLILVSELVFLILFSAWTIVRAANPDAAYTEKPMELAFINSILKSTNFPPEDPWLSGYAISYYYFGYVLISMLIRVTGVASSVAFNLGSSLWFGLTGLAAYGIVYDVVCAWKIQRINFQGGISNFIASSKERIGALLGPFFLLLIGNLEGFFEFLYARHIFWKPGPDGELTSKFWEWLGVLELNVAPTQPVSWLPNRTNGWLWWRGSRVIQDLSISGSNIEVIDEFPFFTYLISDLHPHLLAMPFCLLALALSLNAFLSIDDPVFPFPISLAWLKRWQTWLVFLILGSLAFFNTWDFPIYVGLFALVLSFKQIQVHGWLSKRRILEFLGSVLVLGVGGVVLFLPFYLGFQSQAGGLLPSLEYVTRGINFWIMFGVFLSLIIIWLVFQWRSEEIPFSGRRSLQVTLLVFAFLFAASILWGLLILGIPGLGTSMAASQNPTIASLGNRLMTGQTAFAGLHENYPTADILKQAVLRRMSSPGTWITLGIIFFLVLGFLIKLFAKGEATDSESNSEQKSLSTPNIKFFILFLVLIGGGLTLFPEYFYLRDQFGWRMNTIFKFYFQAWIFWAMAAAFISYELLTSLRRWRSGIFSVFWIILVTAGMAYPILMVLNKTNNFSPQVWTLDGNEYISRYTPDDYLAMQWLGGQDKGIVAEAVGGSYTDFARVSTRTGFPTVLGWPGHESQWRGGSTEMGGRYEDIQRLYETDSQAEAISILQKYDIRYVYIGSLESMQYNVFQAKFEELLDIVYSNANVIIYEVPLDL